MLGLAIVISTLLNLSVVASPIGRRHHVDPLAQLALQKVLQDASPIFGDYVNNKTNTSSWMSRYPDSTKIVHMNIPGTHDTSTWNYSLATQEALLHVTELDGVVVAPPQYYRCQDRPPIAMLNAGIRVFDMRFAFDASNSTLVFYHGAGLQSETASVEDVLFGFYRWLDDHQTEAVLLSFQYEGGTKQYATNDAEVQLNMFNVLTSDSAKKYFVQTKNDLGTLGEARGKITLLRRFDLDQLPQSYSDALPGLHFPPALWIDNSPDITLVYDTLDNSTAYIEDLYEPDGATGAAENIQWKYNATTAHITKATTQYPDSLFWSFASGENDLDGETPMIMALGDGAAVGGVNQRLVHFLQQQKGKRVGIIMFDFYETPGDLIGTMLSL